MNTSTFANAHDGGDAVNLFDKQNKSYIDCLIEFIDNAKTSSVLTEDIEELERKLKRIKEASDTIQNQIAKIDEQVQHANEQVKKISEIEQKVKVAEEQVKRMEQIADAANEVVRRTQGKLDNLNDTQNMLMDKLYKNSIEPLALGVKRYFENSGFMDSLKTEISSVYMTRWAKYIAEYMHKHHIPLVKFDIHKLAEEVGKYLIKNCRWIKHCDGHCHYINEDEDLEYCDCLCHR